MFSIEFCRLWVKIDNMRFYTRIYRIRNILRGERACSNYWIYERTISNKVDR